MSRSFNFQRSANRSGYRGCHKHGKHGWRAVIFDGRQRHLGTFPTLELAAEAYRIAAAQRDAAKLAEATADAERRISAIARTGSKEEIAAKVVELIRITLACDREPIGREEAQRRFDVATKIISGSISIGKGGHAAADVNAAIDADAEELLRPSPKHLLGSHRTSAAAR